MACEQRSSDNHEDRFVKYLVSGSAGILAILHLFYPGFHVDPVGLLLLLIAISPWFIPFLQHYVRAGKIFGTEIEFLNTRMEEQEQQTKRQWDTISEQQKIINKLVVYSLCEQAYIILWILDQGPEFIYRNTENFRRWMYVLLDGGFIQPKGDRGWLEFGDGTEGRNLVELAKATPAGQFLISLRGEPSNKFL
jgi:hypothetical protein